jgi:hypothetical protein
MNLTPILCTDQTAEELMKPCRKNFSPDCAPFHMSQLTLFDLKTRSPISKQTIFPALIEFLENLPKGKFKQHRDPDRFKDGKLRSSFWTNLLKQDEFEIRLKGWLCERKENVRSPFPQGNTQKINIDDYLSDLYQYLGKPKFFLTDNSIFKTPDYFCPNINAIIATQNHGKFPIDKLAMFSFFCPD